MTRSLVPVLVYVFSLVLGCRPESEAKPCTKNLVSEPVAVRYGFEPAWVNSWPWTSDGSMGWQIIPGHAFNRTIQLADLSGPVGRKPGYTAWQVDTLIEFTILTRFSLASNECDTEGSWGLMLGGILGNWEIYLNGKLLQSKFSKLANGKLERQRQIRSLLLEIDRSRMRLGENILALRVIGDANSGYLGLYPGNPFVVGKYHTFTGYPNDIPLIASIAVYFAIGLYHLILFLGRRQDKHDLFFGLFCIMLVVYNITRSDFIFLVSDDAGLVSRIEYASVFIVVIPFLRFIDLILYSKHTTFSKIYAFGATILAILVVIPGPLILAERYLRIWQGGMLLGMLYFIFIHAGRPIAETFKTQYHKTISKQFISRLFLSIFSALMQTSAGNLLLGLFTMIGTATWDILDSVFFRTGIGLTKYGFAVFVLGIAVMIAKRSQRMHKQIEDLNANLERQITVEIQLKDSFARFVPSSFLRILGKRSIPEIKLGDYAEREMTVMFADIRSFTSISERLSPKQTFEFINSYLQGAGPIIRKYGGFIDKYMGDGIMALFESPENAISAALRLQARNTRINSLIGKKLVAPLKVGIGVHTGHLMLGTIGEHQRMDGTVIADAVNLASRVESLTKHYDVSILTTKETLSFAKSITHSARFIDRIAVKGKSTAVDVYQILPHTPALPGYLPPTFVRLWEKAINAYFYRQFAFAQELFKELMVEAPEDKMAKLFFDRCAQNIKAPPPQDWTGLTIATSK